MQPVRMYSTEWCPYCQRAKALLRQRGVETFEDIRLDLDPSQRAAMIQETGRYTVPQIFVGETHVGGCDELMALDRRGALKPLLEGADAAR
jgi:glutaredoxin 3